MPATIMKVFFKFKAVPSCLQSNQYQYQTITRNEALSISIAITSEVAWPFGIKYLGQVMSLQPINCFGNARAYITAGPIKASGAVIESSVNFLTINISIIKPPNQQLSPIVYMPCLLSVEVQCFNVKRSTAH